jgi:hypothetical protein
MAKREENNSRAPTVLLSFDKVSQVAFVVRDLRRSMRNLWEDLGVGPWRIWNLNPTNMLEMTLRGRPANYSILVGMSKVGDVQIELVQPLEGNSIFKEFLEKRGEGIHHLKYTVSDPEQVLERLRKEGIEILQSGKLGQGAFYYLDTESRLGFILELATGQALKLRPPDEIYPPDQAHLVSP